MSKNNGRQMHQRRLRALQDLRPPQPGTNAAASRSHGPHAMICEWNPDPDRPARMRDKFHAMASSKIGTGERALRVCSRCLHRTAARHWSRERALQPGMLIREVTR